MFPRAGNRIKMVPEPNIAPASTSPPWNQDTAKYFIFALDLFLYADILLRFVSCHSLTFAPTRVLYHIVASIYSLAQFAQYQLELNRITLGQYRDFSIVIVLPRAVFRRLSSESYLCDSFLYFIAEPACLWNHLRFIFTYRNVILIFQDERTTANFDYSTDIIAIFYSKT